MDVSGLSTHNLLTNQNIFELESLPERLLVVGGGPVGLELGQACALLGVSVTIITTESRLASREEETVGLVLQNKFDDLGIHVLYHARLLRVESEREAVVAVSHSGETSDSEEKRIPFDALLMAIGRVPVFPRGLEQADIMFTQEGVTVDSQYMTSNRRVYAIGDAVSSLKFTHTADDVARQIVVRETSRGLLRVRSSKAVPKVTYTLPEVASVGHTAESATRIFGPESVRRIEVSYSMNDRAKTDDHGEGVLVVVVRRLTGVVVGAHAAGTSAGNLIALFTVAIDRNISLWKLRDSIYAYPTYSQLVKRAGDLFFAETVHHIRSDVIQVVKKHLPKVFAFLLWGILLLTFSSIRAALDMSTQDFLLMLHRFITTTAWGPLVYIVAYALRPILFFPATLLTLLSGFLFGLPLGILYTVIGENASANIAYGIGKFFGEGISFERSVLGSWIDALKNRPFMSVLFMRLFYVPFDVTNYGSGILGVPWKAYAFATAIGIIPGVSVFVALGASIPSVAVLGTGSFSLDGGYLLFSAAVFIVSLILAPLWYRWHQRQLLKQRTT